MQPLQTKVRRFAPNIKQVLVFCATLAVWATLLTIGLGQSTTAGEKNPQAPPIEPAKAAATQTAPKPLKIGSVNFSGSLHLRVENYRWW
jgi:hypothetical protein